jgi:hypothetical protein
MPLGNIDPNFQAQINQLGTEFNQYWVAASTFGKQPQWILPVKNNWDGSPFTISGPTSFASAYDRTTLNANYNQALQSGNLTDRWSIKTQVDYMAMMERAFRARHATSIRCNAMSLGRQMGQGTQNTGVFYMLVNYLSSVNTIGQSAPP